VFIAVVDTRAEHDEDKMGANGQASLPPDAQRIANLSTQVVDELDVNDGDVLRAVFDLRFGLGVKLKGAIGDEPGAHTGSSWLFGGHGGHAGAGVGWTPIDSPRALKVAVRTAGVGGMTLDGSGGPGIARFIHYGHDYVMRMFEVDANGRYRVAELDTYLATHPLPAFVSPIDPCGEVHA
jgi:hypothetical protein